MFCWKNGRTLDSFTLAYITRGSGKLESQSGGTQTINASDLFILYPGEWHRFQPAPDTGWDEHWVEFDREQARRIMRNPAFSPRQPVRPSHRRTARLRFDLLLLPLVQKENRLLSPRLPQADLIHRSPLMITYKASEGSHGIQFRFV